MLQRLLRALTVLVVLIAPFAAWAAHNSVILTADDVVLRAGSNKHTHRLALLRKGRHLRLLDLQPTNSYYHVKAGEKEGWVSTDYAQLLNYDNVTSGTGGTTTPAAPAAVSLTTEQTAIENAQKFPSNAATVTINGQSCPAEGKKPDNPEDLDPGTNKQKNRTDTAADHGASYLDIHLAAIRDLPFPDALQGESLKNRNSWTGPNDSIATEVGRFEGVPVRVVGYLAKWRPEGDESCNCEYTHVENHDVHLAFTADPGEGENNAVVMEITPRIKRNKQHWAHKWLQPSEDDHRPVRISGWLMMDPKHPEAIGNYRHTLWEVHPITKIEVLDGSSWKDVEDLDNPE
jgi:hypothetical protein